MNPRYRQYSTWAATDPQRLTDAEVVHPDVWSHPLQQNPWRNRLRTASIPTFVTDLFHVQDAEQPHAEVWASPTLQNPWRNRLKTAQHPFFVTDPFHLLDVEGVHPDALYNAQPDQTSTRRLHAALMPAVGVQNIFPVAPPAPSAVTPRRALLGAGL